MKGRLNNHKGKRETQGTEALQGRKENRRSTKVKGEQGELWVHKIEGEKKKSMVLIKTVNDRKGELKIHKRERRTWGIQV